MGVCFVPNKLFKYSANVMNYPIKTLAKYFIKTPMNLRLNIFMSIFVIGSSDVYVGKTFG